MTYVIEGEQTFEIEGVGIRVVKAGMVYSPPNVGHFGRNRTEWSFRRGRRFDRFVIECRHSSPECHKAVSDQVVAAAGAYAALGKGGPTELQPYHDMHQYDGRVLAVASDPEHSFSKSLRQRITLIADHGVEGDAHAGAYGRHKFLARAWPKQPNRRQVHLIRAELFDELHEAGHLVGPGDLGENVTTTAIELEHLPL